MAESEIKVTQEQKEKRVPITRENVKYPGGGGGAVNSVNGQTGDVVLDAEDVGALPDTTVIPTAVSELTNDSDFQTGQEVADAIGIETTAREGADSNLQSQIDAIVASSDVTDIVGTYADLEDYDTSTLGNNDIIKVLQDEQHSDETTYYRWSTTTQTFTLIGEEGPYYTKSAADAKFQDKLTAGANVNIDANNEISATDTTYSNFTGTTGQTAGASGLVPAPATTDAGKFLKADGTWAASGGGFNPYSETRNYSDIFIPDGPNYSQNSTSVFISPYSSGTPTIPSKAVNILGDATNNNSTVSIGYKAKSSGTFAIAIGEATAKESGVSIGKGSASGNRGIAIGHNAVASSSYGSVLVGYQANVATGSYDVAIGYDSQVGLSYAYSASIGAHSRVSRSGEVNIGTGSTTNGYNSTSYRVLGGVHDAVADHDAVNLQQLNSRIVGSGTTAPTSSTAGSVGSLYAYVESGTGHLAICTDVSGTTYTWQTLI